MYIYLFRCSLFSRELKKIVTSFPVTDRDLLMNLANPGIDWRTAEHIWVMTEIVK